jgi:uncharacterized membrane protein
MPYKHTQIGYVVIFAMLAAAIVALAFKATILLLIASAVGILFSTLTVSVESDCVRLWFGPGFIPMRFFLGDIESCQAAKFRCCAWGICGWPGKGWIINVSGFRTVELKMRKGGKYYIGTDQPEALEEAIRKSMHRILLRALKTD